MTGDIVITLVVKPLKGGKRPIIVSGAPAGEMPLILTDHFPDRMALLDAAFERLLTRKPKIVKVAEAKKVAAKKGEPEKESEAEETVEAPAPEAKPDQLVRQEELPIIEGDGPHESAAQFLASADVLAGFEPQRVQGCTCGNTPCTCPF